MAYVGTGSLLRVASTAGSGGTVDTDVAEVINVSMNGISVAEIDTTGIGDTSRTAKVGVVDNGTINASMYLMDSSSGLLTYLEPKNFAAGATAADGRKFTLRFGAAGVGSTAAFTGYVTSLNVSAGIDAVIQASITIRIAGAITWTG